MKQPRQICSIQVLRGIAALLVVMHHASNFLNEHSPGSGFDFKIGAIGVDIFFIISGFIMYCSTVRHTGAVSETLAFWKKRIIRIAPLYWLITASIVIVSVIHPPTTLSVGVSLSGFVKSVLFIPYAAAGGPVQPVLGQGWTLNYEMFFYAVIGVALLVSRRYMLICILSVFALFQLASWYVGAKSVVVSYYASPLMLEFAAGVILAMLYRSGRLPRHWLLSAAVALGAIGLTFDEGFRIYFTSEWHRVAVWGAFSLILVASFVGSEAWWKAHAPRIMMFLGDASYSIYLSHIAAFSLIWKVLRPSLAHNLPTVSMLFSLCLFAVLFGAALYWVVERRLVRIFSSDEPRVVAQAR